MPASGWLDATLCLLKSETFHGFTIACGVVVAVVSVLTARAIARKKQSADLLFSSRNDDKLQKGFRYLRTYNQADDQNIASLAYPGPGQEEEAAAVKYFLNHMEVVAVGIQAGIYDETMLKKSWYTMVTNAWDNALPLVRRLRQPGPDGQPKTALQEYQWLYKRWRNKPLKARPQNS